MQPLPLYTVSSGVGSPRRSRRGVKQLTNAQPGARQGDDDGPVTVGERGLCRRDLFEGGRCDLPRLVGGQGDLVARARRDDPVVNGCGEQLGWGHGVDVADRPRREPLPCRRDFTKPCTSPRRTDASIRVVAERGDQVEA